MNERKSISIVTMELGWGGAERVLSELMKEWVRTGNKVTLVQTRPGIFGESYPIPEGVNNITFQIKSKNRFEQYAKEIIALFRYMKNNPDTSMLAFSNASIRIVAVCSMFFHNRIVFSERNDPRHSPQTEFLRWLRYKLYNLADTCVFQTHQAMSLFPKKVQKKGIVIPNPVNPDLPPAHNGERNKTIITACRLEPQKNLPMLINAFAMLHKSNPDYLLEIYGEGSEYEKLQGLIDQLGLADYACLKGRTLSIYEVMKNSAIYVCSSDYEGLSNSLIEALALGMSVISTDHPIGGASEMIEDHVNGLLIPVGDVNALYCAMKYLIENPDAARKLAENASHIKEKWPIEKIAQKWLTIL